MIPRRWRRPLSRSCSPTSPGRRRFSAISATKRRTTLRRGHFDRCEPHRRAWRPRGQVDGRRPDGRVPECGGRRSLRRRHAACHCSRRRAGAQRRLDAGEPIPEGDDLYGTPVIVASRLCDTAGAGEILASEVVCRRGGRPHRRADPPVVALRLRGVAERVAAAQVGWRGERSRRSPPRVQQREIRVVVADDQRAGASRLPRDPRGRARHHGRRRGARRAHRRRRCFWPPARRRPDGHPNAELDGLEAAERILSEPDSTRPC